MTYIKSMPLGILTMVFAIYFNIGAVLYNLLFPSLIWLSFINITAAIVLIYTLNANFFYHYTGGPSKWKS